MNEEDPELHAMLGLDEVIEDGGFTDRVLATLPPPRTKRSLRALIIGSSAVVACAAALALDPRAAGFVAHAVIESVSVSSWSSVPLASLAVVVSALWAGVALAGRE
jgi:hypothetical protein